MGNMPFQTTLTIPTANLPELTRRLTKAGFTILDTGERITTDSGADAEATLHLVDFATDDETQLMPMGVSR